MCSYQQRDSDACVFHRLTWQVLPASWAIPVDGRAPDDEPAVVPEESEEDSVCQVCFDGESFEANPIVFCDKCNIAIHKVALHGLLLLCLPCDLCWCWCAALLWHFCDS